MPTYEAWTLLVLNVKRVPMLGTCCVRNRHDTDT